MTANSSSNTGRHHTGTIYKSKSTRRTRTPRASLVPDWVLYLGAVLVTAEACISLFVWWVALR